MIDAPRPEQPLPEQPRRRATWPWLVAILFVAGVGTWALVTFAPRTPLEEERASPKLVKFVPAEAHDASIVVTAYGSVIPSRELTIRPQVSGRVVRHHPSLIPGGILKKDEPIVSIERADYELALAEKTAALETAQYELDLEKGRQVVASREWRLLGGEVPPEDANRSLVLREPHLRRARALIELANNDIRRATLDLDRTEIACPFNATVLDESVEEGQLVESGSSVATLVGTDEFWVRVAVPFEKISRLKLPQGSAPGARASVILETGNGAPVRREGHVIRLLSDLEPDGRLARLLVSVRDPLLLDESAAGTSRVPLLLGSYVRVEIDAGVVPGVVEVDRSAVRPGDRVWVVSDDDTLQIRPVTIAWSRRDSVLVTGGVEPGDRLIVSGLRVALPGMRLDPQPAVDRSDPSSTARHSARPPGATLERSPEAP